MSAPISEAIQATPEQVGFKVFIGNLSFNTKDADVKEAFSKHGKVYGFVTFESESEATASVSALDKSDLQGRTVNVELAKPSTGTAAGRAPKEAAQAAIKNGATEGEVVVDGEGGATKKKSRNNKNKKARRPRVDDETEEAGDAPLEGSVTNGAATTEGGESSATEKPKRAPKKRKPKSATTANAEGSTAEATTATGEEGTEEKPKRAPRPARRGPPTGEPSKTLIFVGNLSFQTTDDSLAQALSDCAGGINYSKVVVKKFGHSAGKSKGFAFVDFKTEQGQKDALEKAQGREVDGRPISVKVAIEGDKKDGEEAEKAAPAVAEA